MGRWRTFKRSSEKRFGLDGNPKLWYGGTTLVKRWFLIFVVVFLFSKKKSNTERPGLESLEHFPKHRQTWSQPQEEKTKSVESRASQTASNLKAFLVFILTDLKWPFAVITALQVMIIDGPKINQISQWNQQGNQTPNTAAFVWVTRLWCCCSHKRETRTSSHLMQRVLKVFST